MDDFRSIVIVTAIILIMCSTLSVSLRLCRSFYMLGKLSWHDGLIIFAMLCAIIMSVGMALLTTAGLGLHDSNGAISRNSTFQKSLIVINVFYLLCNMFIKLGLLLMYHQFTMEWYYHWLIYVMHAATIIFGVSSVFAVIFQCVPISSSWDSSVVGHCVNIPAFYYANAGIMIGMDLILYIMPILFTWSIQLPRAQKFGLRFLFGLGFLVIVASCIRLYVVDDVLKHGDLSYNSARMLIASAVENHLAICIACAPAIRAMLSRFLIPKMQDYYTSSRDRLSRLPTASTSRVSCTPPSSPQESFFTSTKRSRGSTMHSRLYAGVIGPLAWSLKPRSKTPARDPDLESMDFDFHDTMPNPLPTIHTLIAQGPDPSLRPYTSEKEADKIYVKREISTRETFLIDGSPVLDRDLDYISTQSDVDGQSNHVAHSTTGESTSGILVVPPLAFFEEDRDVRRCECGCHPGRVVSPAHLCGWCTPECY